MPEQFTLVSKWRGEVGVDFEAGVIRGMVLAEAGPLKSRRGEFDELALDAVAELINAQNGVDSHLGHNHVSESMSLDFLGFVDGVKVDRSPKPARVRGDLHFEKSAFAVPGKGDLATYVMQRAKERPQSISSSLVLYADLEPRPPLKRGGKMVEQLSLLRPVAVLGSDIVRQGDAVNSILSFDPEEPDDDEVDDDDTDPLYDRWPSRRRLLTARLKMVLFR